MKSMSVAKEESQEYSLNTRGNKHQKSIVSKYRNHEMSLTKNTKRI